MGQARSRGNDVRNWSTRTSRSFSIGTPASWICAGRRKGNAVYVSLSQMSMKRLSVPWASIRHLFGERVIQASDYLTRSRLGYPMHTLAIGPRAYFLENLNK